MSRLAATALALFLLAGCASRDVTVVAGASSLTDALTTIAHDLELRLGAEVETNIAGTQTLVAAIEAGAPVDVLIAADRATLRPLELTGAFTVLPQPVAYNRLAMIVPAGNPAGLDSLASLASVERLVLAAPEVPLGRYTAELLADRGVGLQPLSWETSARAVVAKVATGEADAAIAYESDGRLVGVTAIPLDADTSYWLGLSPQVPDREIIVDYFYGPDGQRAFALSGLQPVR